VEIEVLKVLLFALVAIVLGQCLPVGVDISPLHRDLG
jgi:hypothetical protein